MYGGCKTDRELPHELVCPERPSELESFELDYWHVFASGENFAYVADIANEEGVANGKITEIEAFNLLFCMAEWGEINECEAFDIFDHFQETCGPDFEVTVDYAAAVADDYAAKVAASMVEE